MVAKPRHSFSSTVRLSFERLEYRTLLAGDMVFAESVLYRAGDAPASATAADLNGDGVLDLIAPNFECCGQLAVLLGNGDGSFASARSFRLKGEHVVVGDFDRDGDLDVASTQAQGRRGVYVALNEGSSGFKWAGLSRPVYFPVPDHRPRFLTSGDFDNDGFLDVAVTDNTFVAVLLNNGVGPQGQWDGFAESVDYLAGQLTSSIATADVDRDGVLDLVVDNAVGGDVSVLQGNRNGTFDAPVNFPGEFGGTLADMDADGNLDLVGNRRVLLGDGDGTFTAAAPDYPIEVFGISTTDLDGDGDLDILGISVRNERNDRVRLLINHGDATFTEKEDAFPRTLGNPQGATAADFDGDGDLDVAVPTAFGGSPGNVEVFFNTTEPQADAFPGDANLDGQFNQLDIVHVLQAGKYLTGTPSTFAEGDWTGDGVFDQLDIVAALATGNYLPGSNAARTLSQLVDDVFKDERPLDEMQDTQ